MIFDNQLLLIFFSTLFSLYVRLGSFYLAIQDPSFLDCAEIIKGIPHFCQNVYLFLIFPLYFESFHHSAEIPHLPIHVVFLFH